MGEATLTELEKLGKEKLESLNGQINDLKNEIAKTGGLRDQANKEVEVLSNRIETLTSNLEGIETDISKRESDWKKKEEGLVGKISSREHDVADRESKVSERESKVKTSESSIASKDAKVRYKATDVVSLIDKIVKANSESLNSLKSEIIKFT